MNDVELLSYLIKNILGHENFKIKEEISNKINYTVTLNKKDFGKVVGKNGKIADAIKEIFKNLNNVKKRVYIKFKIEDLGINE